MEDGAAILPIYQRTLNNKVVYAAALVAVGQERKTSKSDCDGPTEKWPMNNILFVLFHNIYCVVNFK